VGGFVYGIGMDTFVEKINSMYRIKQKGLDNWLQQEGYVDSSGEFAQYITKREAEAGEWEEDVANKMVERLGADWVALKVKTVTEAGR